MSQSLHSPILPEALTCAQVRDLLQTIRRDPTRFEDGLAAHCTLWLRWDASGRDHNEHNARRANALKAQGAVLMLAYARAS
jgi:hypothetical protein